MNRKSFSVGEVQCIAISDGTFSYPPSWFFSNAPEQELEGSLREHHVAPNQIVSPYTCLVIKTQKETVLVDTGADGLAPTTGDLIKNLKAENVAPENIKTVVLTHGHPDHIGGVLDAEGKAAFPNARYVMSETEWKFWTSGRPNLNTTGLDEHMKEVLVSCARKNLLPLEGTVDLLEGEKELVPGVYAIPAPGHTPGHLAIVISSANEQLLHIVDAVLHPIHLEHPSWRNIFDLNEDEAVRTRQKLLDRVAAEKATILAYHFPFPGLGHVASSGSAWKWEAMDA